MIDTPVPSAIDQFRDAIARKGITPPHIIESDGKLHRFSSNGKPDDDAGWYVFHDGAVAAGAFGDFRTGQTVASWVADIGRSLTVAEKSDFQAKQAAIRSEREARTEQLRAEARAKAAKLAEAAAPMRDIHPYLVRKNVGAHGIGVWENPDVAIRYSAKTNKPFLQITSQNGGLQVNFSVDLEGKSPEAICESWKSILLIPMYDASGKLQSFQFISKDGDKKFLYGGMMQGCFFPIGNIENFNTILIAEGYATAATLHETTGFPVVVAYNAGNLMPVAKAIRARRPDADIVICADDDWKTAGNPGLTKAQDAAAATHGFVLAPEFDENRPDKATDFNDMAALAGKDAVTGFFTQRFLEGGLA
jgi:putative DNA primase/helicase